MNEFADWNVIVTGGTRGIGLAVTEAFLSEGADVTAIYKGNKSSADLLRKKFPDSKLSIAQLDISDYNAVEAFFKDYGFSHSPLLLSRLKRIIFDPIFFIITLSGLLKNKLLPKVIQSGLSSEGKTRLFNLTGLLSRRLS